MLLSIRCVRGPGGPRGPSPHVGGGSRLAHRCAPAVTTPGDAVASEQCGVDPGRRVRGALSFEHRRRVAAHAPGWLRAARYGIPVTGGAAGRSCTAAAFHLIVDEAFSSTLVNGPRVRVDLNQVGMWFADPADDDFCLGPNSPVTPFDGDNEAGVQAFNSADTTPLPAP